MKQLEPISQEQFKKLLLDLYTIGQESNSNDIKEWMNEIEHKLLDVFGKDVIHDNQS